MASRIGGAFADGSNVMRSKEMNAIRCGALTCLLLVFVAPSFGCGGEPEPQDKTPIVLVDIDSGEDTDQGIEPEEDMSSSVSDMAEDLGVTEPRCPEVDLPEQLTMIEGGRWSYEDAARAIASIEIEGGTSWRADDRWFVRLPYGQEEASLVAALDCEAGEQQIEVAVTLEPLRWEDDISWSGAEGPSAREHTMLWFFENQRYLYLYGGYVFTPQQFTTDTELWRFDLETSEWEQITIEGESPSFAGGRHVVLPDEQAVLLVGGDAPRRGESNSADWKLTVGEDGVGRWEREEPMGGPGTASLTGMIYDTLRQRVVLTLGLAGNRLNDRIWSRDADGSWSDADFVGADQPALRYGFAYAHDEDADRLVVLSGARLPNMFSQVNAARDLWALDLETLEWTELTPTGDAPRGRRNGCWAHDTKHHRLLMWGGTADARTSEQDLIIVDLDPGKERWRSMEFPEGPRARASCSGIYDAARGQAIFGFGNDELGLYTDLQRLVLD